MMINDRCFGNSKFFANSNKHKMTEILIKIIIINIVLENYKLNKCINVYFICIYLIICKYFVFYIYFYLYISYINKNVFRNIFICICLYVFVFMCIYNNNYYYYY